MRLSNVRSGSRLGARALVCLAALASLYCSGGSPVGPSENVAQQRTAATGNGWVTFGPFGVTQVDGNLYTGTTTDVENPPGTGLYRLATLGNGILEYCAPPTCNFTGWNELTASLVPPETLQNPPIAPTSGEGLGAYTLATRPGDSATIVFGTMTDSHASIFASSGNSGIWLGKQVQGAWGWTQVALPANVGDVFKIRWSDANTVHAATSTGYWQSVTAGNVPAGTTWTQVVTGYFSDLAVFSANPLTVLLAENNVGLLEYQNGVKTLIGVGTCSSCIPSAPGNSRVATDTNGNIFYMASVAKGAVQGFYRIINLGSLFEIHQSMPICGANQTTPPWVGCFPGNCGTCVSGGNSSTDWAIAMAAHTAGAGSPTTVLAAGNGLVRSQNANSQVPISQVTWNRATLSTLPHGDFHGLGFDSSGNALSGSDAGYFYSLNGGVDWKSDSNTSRMTSITDFDIQVVNGTFTAYGTAWDTGNYATHNSGSSWTSSTPNDGDQIYITADPHQQDSVYQTNSFGCRTRSASGSWPPTQQTGPESNGCVAGAWPRIVSDQGKPGVFLYTWSGTTASNAAIYQSTDSQPGVRSWHQYDALLNQKPPLDVSAGTRFGPDGGDSYVYALVNGVTANLYAEFAGNSGWTNINPVVNGAAVQINPAPITHPTNGAGAYALGSGLPAHIFATTNVQSCLNTRSGSCWQEITGDFPSTTVQPVDLAVVPPFGSDLLNGTLYVATTSGVYRSTNNGVNWKRWIQNLPGRGSERVNRLRSVDSRPSGGKFWVYAGVWGSGLWYRDGSESE